MDETLNPSALGTLKYWDDAYQCELDNFNDHGDVGEVWFGEVISRKIVKWIISNSHIKHGDKIIDIGCGNGMLLIDLYQKGFTSLYGIDYSENAINLALNISKKGNCNINFTVANILENSFQPIYDLALDKGTFDAISLDPNDSKSKRLIYIQNVWKLLKINGILLITSCNWTEDELKEQFLTRFAFVETLPAPSFTFGGQRGSTVTSVVFKKTDDNL